MKNLHTTKTSNGSDFGWLIHQLSINQKVGGRRFVEGLYRLCFRFALPAGMLFICYLQSETKIEPDLRLWSRWRRETSGFGDVAKT